MKDLRISPQETVTGIGKLENPCGQAGRLYQVIPLLEFYSEGEEVAMLNTVVTENGVDYLPVLIVNHLPKTIWVQSEVEQVKTIVINVESRVRFKKRDYRKERRFTEINEEEIEVPKENRNKIIQLLRKNKDVGANSEKELGKTHIVKIRRDTGDHQLLKLKPYRMPRHEGVGGMNGR